MAHKERLEIIRAIQAKRNSFVISYITSTKQGLEVQMAMDCIRHIYDHLKRLPVTNDKPNIDLFIHSNGGDTTVPWRLVTLIREHAKEFSVLVPYKAFSAATLTALGADHVVMHPMGMLGPTDPTVTNPFNPVDPTNPAQRIGISVEDVSAYIALIKEDAGISHEDELVQAFNKLADNVHPLALGNVKRSLSQSRMMAQKLLGLHMSTVSDGHTIDEIVDKLTSKLFYHGHPINRIEAREHIGLTTVQSPSDEVSDLMWQLYLDYEQEFAMEEPFQPAMEFVAAFPQQLPNVVDITGLSTARLVMVESEHGLDEASVDYQISGVKQPDGTTNTQVVFLRQGWVSIQ